MEEEKKIVKKKKNKYIIIVFLFALIVGGSCGLYYVDTFYGEGKINTIISSLQEKTQKNTDITENPAEQLRMP